MMRGNITASSAPARSRSIPGLLLFGGLTVGAALLGWMAQSRPDSWYRRLKKPSFTPPAWVFGPVWTVLYTLNALSGYQIWKRRREPGAGRALGLWGAQLGANAAWTPLFFGLRKPGAALIDVLLLNAALAAYRREAKKIAPVASKMVLPYALWVAFATLLNEEIWRKNRGREEDDPDRW